MPGQRVTIEQPAKLPIDSYVEVRILPSIEPGRPPGVAVSCNNSQVSIRRWEDDGLRVDELVVRIVPIEPAPALLQPPTPAPTPESSTIPTLTVEG